MSNEKFDRKLEILNKKILELKNIDQKKGKNEIESFISNIEKKINTLTTPKEKKAIDIVKLSRNSKRPTSNDIINEIIDDFIELHGDRHFCDDKAIIGGIGFLGKFPVTIIGHQKGRDTHDNIKRNFGMANPEGYRKAIRLMKEAELFNRFIINLIDTPGAYPGIGAEERGQSQAIAYNLYTMSTLKVPIISIITGEGGSGGALALGLADRSFMLSNAIYSVISPEGCAAILWKDSTKTELAAEVLKLTANDLYRFKIIDNIIEEPEEGAHTDIKKTTSFIKETLLEHFEELSQLDLKTLLSKRYDKYRKIGKFIE